jgi:DNA-binding response OmpR family regulator
MSRILVAEDEPGISSFVVKGLKAAGHAAFVVEDGESALWEARSGEFDLLVLDLGLPGMDGLSVLADLRKGGHQIPVVILTARDDVDTLVTGLDLGASDFIAKPFRFDELLARIRSRLRETGHLESKKYEFADVVVDVAARRVERAGRVVELTAKEFLLLETFLIHKGQVLSRQQLLSHVWGYDFETGSNVVDVYVRYLRKKLGSGLITTIRGVGYRMGETD